MIYPLQVYTWYVKIQGNRDQYFPNLYDHKDNLDNLFKRFLDPTTNLLLSLFVLHCYFAPRTKSLTSPTCLLVLAPGGSPCDVGEHCYWSQGWLVWILVLLTSYSGLLWKASLILHFFSFLLLMKAYLLPGLPWRINYGTSCITNLLNQQSPRKESRIFNKHPS